MVNFEDLSLEDQKKLLDQARQMVDEENTKKHAVAMYGLKRKELTENNLEVIYKYFGLKMGPEQSAAKQRYISMTNYLYKMMTEKRYRGNNTKAMSTEEEWTTYKNVSNKVKDMMINN